jgi:hypothetical protein
MGTSIYVELRQAQRRWRDFVGGKATPQSTLIFVKFKQRFVAGRFEYFSTALAYPELRKH